MAEQFLYLLGAGASAQALPIVKQKTQWRASLHDSMREMSSEILTRTSGFEQKRKAFFNSIAEDLKKLADDAHKFTTIDTYAKYLYIKDRSKLEDLKVVLSTYFILEQLWFGRLDQRYIVWLTNIMADSTFPRNIKVLSWNYDFQLQLAAETFSIEELNIHNTITKRSGNLLDYYPFPGMHQLPTIDAEECNLFHLNGIAGLYFSGKYKRYLTPLLNGDRHRDMNILDDYIDSAADRLFHFAWEQENKRWNSDFIKKMISDTTIMVIIGYSFPFFNREIDHEIFKCLKDAGKLKKIYFQDPKLDGSFLYNQFNLRDAGFRNDIIKHIQEVDALYVPFEL